EQAQLALERRLQTRFDDLAGFQLQRETLVARAVVDVDGAAAGQFAGKQQRRIGRNAGAVRAGWQRGATGEAGQERGKGERAGWQGAGHGASLKEMAGLARRADSGGAEHAFGRLERLEQGLADVTGFSI